LDMLKTVDDPRKHGSIQETASMSLYILCSLRPLQSAHVSTLNEQCCSQA
jgi:hypothetical protein